MEQKIIFLIMILFILFIMFTEKGQVGLKKYLGINVVPKGAK